MRNFIFIIAFFFTYIGSKPKDNESGLITIVNSSNDNIIVSYSKKFPDTSYMKNEKYSVCSIDYPDTICLAYDKGWKGRFNQNQLGTLIFFVENKDTIIKYGVDSLYANPEKFIYKKYFLTIDSMEQANWKLYVY